MMLDLFFCKDCIYSTLLTVYGNHMQTLQTQDNQAAYNANISCLSFMWHLLNILIDCYEQISPHAFSS